MTLTCQRIAGWLPITLAVTGCAHFKLSVPTAQPKSTQAVLTAASTNQISLFGELAQGEEQTYYTRTAVSLKRHTFAEVGQDLDADIDATGTRMVFASTRHNIQPDIYIKAVDGVAVTQLTADPASDVQPVFSPDASKVAFASNRSGNWDIWIIDVQGGTPIQVTSGKAEEVHPGWSPDGNRLVYCSLPAGGGQWELWITDVGAGFTKRFIGYGLFPEWSPVADTIVFQRARERGTRRFSIWTMTLVNGEPRYPTEVAANASYAMILPTWSPDGKQIAFATTTVDPETTNGEADSSSKVAHRVFDLWLMNADGRGRTRLTDGHTANYAPVFSAQHRIFFTSDRSGHDNIWSLLPGGSGLVESPDGASTGQTAAAGTDIHRSARTTADRHE